MDIGIRSIWGASTYHARREMHLLTWNRCKWGNIPPIAAIENLLCQIICRTIRLERMKVNVFSVWFIFHFINEIDTTMVHYSSKLLTVITGNKQNRSRFTFILSSYPVRQINNSSYAKEILNQVRYTRALNYRALHPQKLDIGYCLKIGDIVTLKFGYWILPTEKEILGSLKIGYWDISLDM